jgi:hypothetical protein
MQGVGGIYRIVDVIGLHQNSMANAKPAKTKTRAINALTIRHVVHLGNLRNSFTASTSLV